MRVLVVTSCTWSKRYRVSNPLQWDDFLDADRLQEREAHLARWRAKAGDMYTGKQHLRVMGAIRLLRDARVDVHLAVISAGYGAVTEDRELVPYDVSFSNLEDQEVARRAEFLGIPQSVRSLISGFDLIIFLLGEKYLAALQLPLVAEPHQRIIYFARPRERRVAGSGVTVVPAGANLCSAFGVEDGTELKGAMFEALSRTISTSPDQWLSLIHRDDSAATIQQAMTKGLNADVRREQTSPSLGEQLFNLDIDRAKLVAVHLLTSYHRNGIFGNEAMPEDQLPVGMAPGSEEHLRFLTLTVALDYRRKAAQLWDAARRTYTDPGLAYLFLPDRVAQTAEAKLKEDLLHYHLAWPDEDHEKDPWIWQSICRTLVNRFDGRVSAVLDGAGHDALDLLALITRVRGFPYLKGPKISPLWVRMLHDNAGVKLKRIEQVLLPVDIHTAQATIQLGCVSVNGVSGEWERLAAAVQRVWSEAVSTLGGDAYSLRLDEPLWLLSKDGCRSTRSWPCDVGTQCPVSDFCQPTLYRLARSKDGQSWSF